MSGIVHVQMQQAPLAFSQVNAGILNTAIMSAIQTGTLDASQIAQLNQVHTTDVAKSIAAFHKQMLLLAGSDGVPAVEAGDGPPVPLNIAGSVPDAIKPADTMTLAAITTLAAMAKDAAASAGLAPVSMTPDAAEDSFRQRVLKFLGFRADYALGERKGILPNAGTSEMPTLNVTVHTKKKGLQILYSPAYFLSVRTSFGKGLSTPVKGPIGPGIYLFGTRKPDAAPKFEPVEHAIPPDSEIHIIDT